MTESPSSVCPECGSPLRRLPMVDGAGHLVTCSNCGYESIEREPTHAPASASNDGERRFRDLMNSAKTSTDNLSQSLFEELPEERRRELQQRLAKKDSRVEDEDEPGSPTGNLTDMEKRLRQQGYYLYTDHTGPHLSGQGPKPGTGDLSALDVVRLAAELEGGIPSADERHPCPHCQAVVSGRPERCPWCGNSMQPDPGD